MLAGFSSLNQPQDFEVSGTATTTLAAIGNSVRLDRGVTFAAIEVKNGSGSIALSEFDVQVKAHAAGEWITVANDFSTEDGIMLFASTDPEALAAGGAAFVLLQLGPVDAVRFRAKSASSTVATTIRGRLY